MDFNIESTDDIVEYINDILYKKCGTTLRIEFDLFDEMIAGKPLEYFDIFDPDAETPLMLCLFLGKKCISSITCKINFADKAFEISSKTNESHQGKKYNLFLRYAMVLILHNIEYTIRVKRKTRSSSFEKIISRAINPISILAMSKHFYATNDKFDSYMEKNGLDYEDLTLEHTKHFYDELTDIPDDLPEDELEEYYEKYIDPYDPVVMIINLRDERTIQNAMDKIISTRILCPEKKTSKRRMKTRSTMKSRSSSSSSSSKK
jgi:hypothetical protein